MACWYQPLPGSSFVSALKSLFFLVLRHTKISINNKYKNNRDIIIADHGFKGKNNALYVILSSR